MKEPTLEEKYRQIPQTHIDSFNYFLDEGIHRVIAHLPPTEIEHPITKKIYKISISNPVLGRPTHTQATDGGLIYPRECREMKLSYTAPLDVDIMIGRICINRRLCNLPIMVKSRACNLRGMTQREMRKRGEEGNDFGGYFIAGGLEKVIRMLFTQKRHFIMAKDRANYARQGANFTSRATNIRNYDIIFTLFKSVTYSHTFQKCVREDEVGRSVSCHYLRNGFVVIGFSIGYVNFFLPVGVVLRALYECNDRELFEHLISGSREDQSETQSSYEVFVAQHAEATIRKLSSLGLKTQMECIEYLGSYFRAPMIAQNWRSNYEVGIEFLQEYIFCHLTSLKKKFSLLIQMIQKLYSFVNSKCCEDSSDSLGSHEIIPSGFLMMKIFGDLLRQHLGSLKALIERSFDQKGDEFDLEDLETVNKIINRTSDLTRKLLHFLKTGRFSSMQSRDVGQDTGLTIIAERINFLRYLSHYRAVHRGMIYTQMRTTQPRKLLPDSWGFVCPVHTPDGPPCGLLLHLTSTCRISIPSRDQQESTIRSINQLLVGNGMIPSSSELAPPCSISAICVMIDGEVMGYLAKDLIPGILNRFQLIKALNNARRNDSNAFILQQTSELDSAEIEIPFDCEISYFPPEEGEPFPSLIISTQGGRLIRPVRQIATNLEEWIGPQEQLSLGIKCPDGTKALSISDRELYTHEEYHSNNFLSILACLTPFSDFNQSPRNMYQCQMAKQTMGTPCHDFEFRPETKLYRLTTPQKPICRTKEYQKFELDEYPSGTNAVVAVLAYTGYDMEDAMILNQASIDRGFGHGCIYKTSQIFLDDERQTEDQVFLAETTPSDKKSIPSFGQDHSSSKSLPRNVPSQSANLDTQPSNMAKSRDYLNAERIDVDGLPHVGAVIKPQEPYCCTYDQVTNSFRNLKLKGDEIAFVEQVGVVNRGTKSGLKSANIKLRFERKPVIGDKFASRAGQKGILSTRWADIDFPYCARTGMRPDLIINPHAFPSRMTIGMLIESLTSKSGALIGEFIDCSPFRQCDEPDLENIVESCGKQLMHHGFHHQGTETMISGITGEEMQYDIYIGLVYYQRLRHMVSDKHQCRAIGPVNQMTKQPIKGRKAGGGIRLGEMERDALLAHGCSFVLNDRLSLSSDRCIAMACGKCQSINGPHTKQVILPEIEARMFQRLGSSGKTLSHVICPICGNASDAIIQYPIPRVLQLLAVELCALNIWLNGIPNIACKPNRE